MNELRAKKIGPGYYEVPTPHGTYRVENTPSPKGSGYGSGPNWLIVSPGEEVADASKSTKREAMEYIQILCDERETAPAPGAVELPSNEEQARQAARPRYVVAQLDTGYFAVVDNVTNLHVVATTSRKHAHDGAAELNANSEEPKQDHGPSLDDYAKASRIIQSLIPRGRRQ